MMIRPHSVRMAGYAANHTIDWGQVVDLDGHPTGEEPPYASTPDGLSEGDFDDIVNGFDTGCKPVVEPGWVPLVNCADHFLDLTDGEMLELGRRAGATRIALVPVEDEKYGEAGWTVLARLNPNGM